MGGLLGLQRGLSRLGSLCGLSQRQLCLSLGNLRLSLGGGFHVLNELAHLGVFAPLNLRDLAALLHAAADWPKMRAWQAVGDALGLKGPVVNPDAVPCPLQRCIDQVGPALALLVGHIENFGALAVDGVQLYRFLPQLAGCRHMASRKHDVRMPVAVMPASRY